MIERKNKKCKLASVSSIAEIESEKDVGNFCNAVELLKTRLTQSQLIANYATWEWSVHSNGVVWSDNLYNLLQYDPKKVTPSVKALFKRIHPDDLKLVHQTINKSKKEDGTNEVEFRIKLPDDSIRILYCYTSITYDHTSNENPTLIGTVQDITDRKRAEKELSESEERYRNIIEIQPVCVKTITADGTLISMNSTGLQYIEAESMEEVQGACVYDLIIPEYRELFIKLNERVFNGETVDAEFRIEGLKGTQRWMETHAVPIYENDSDTKVTAHLAITRDISQRKENEKILLENEELFRNTFNNAPLGMGLGDKEGNILRVNKTICDMSGYSESELLSKNFRDFVHPDELEKSVENLQRLFSGEIDFYKQTRRYIHKKGHLLWLDVNVSIVKDSEGKPKYLVNHLQDVTERVQSESLKETQHKILKQIVKGGSQEEILTNLCLMFEAYTPTGGMASVLLLNPEEQKLYVGAAPSMSDDLVNAFNGFAIGKNKASCGTAAYFGQTVIVEDVETNECWQDFKDFAVDNDIRACWSTPFFAENGDVLGTFAISHPQQVAPTEYDLERLEMAGYLASIVVVRTRSIQAISDSENKFSTAFRAIPDVVSISSVPDGRFIEVNDHFLERSGYERDEIIGNSITDLGIWADEDERNLFISRLKKQGAVRDMEARFRNRHGDTHDCLVSAEIITIDQHKYSLVITKDISELKRLELLKTSRNQILEALAKSHNLVDVLKVIASSTSDLISHSSVSILQTDKEGKYLLNGIGYNLPDFFVDSINGLEIETSSCPCTRAANEKTRIIIADLNKDHDCSNMMELIQKTELAACWVQPVLSARGIVLGTLAIYFEEAKQPTNDELEIIDSMARITAFAIERKRDEEVLRESEARFRSTFGDAPMGTAIVDKHGDVIQINERSTKIIGYLPEEIIGKSIADVTHPDDLDKSLKKYKMLMAGEIDQYQIEKQYQHKDGNYFWARVSISSVKDEDGIPQYSIAHIEDISERRHSEQALHRYNRALRVLNQCNATLFHATNAEELFKEVCDIVVETGGYRFAWVGYIQADNNKTIKPMAKSGYEAGYLDARITLINDDKYYCSLTDAIKSLEAKTIRNIKTEKAELNWREAALERGYASTISLPLISDNEAFGAISIYAGEADVFDEEEITLLKNLADNLSFGIQSITNKSVREEAERSLRLSEQKFRTLFDENPCMFFTVDESATVLSVNNFGASELGYKPEQIIGRTLFSFTDDEDIYSIDSYLKNCLNNPSKVYRWEMQALRKNGSKMWVRVLARVANDKNYKNTIFVVCEDITEAHLLSEKLRHEATHDGLTGLINRREFEERLQRAILSAQSNNNHVLCYMDLDRFKVINDSCGHVAGDKLLKQLSDLLHSNLRSRDSLARLGGDEFGLLIENCTINKAEKIAEKIKDEITNFRFYWEDNVYKVGVSIGMVEINARSVNVSDILMVADNACYTAKDKGRDRIYIHKEGDAELESRRKDILWTTRIQNAFDENRFCLFYQPIIPIDQNDDNGEHGEILVRMEDEEGNIIPPNTFIPVAERYNLITSIDKYVIEMTFNWLDQNRDFLKKMYLVSINLSGPSLIDSDVLKCIIKTLLKYNIPANKICFEVTETSAIANLNKANHFISVLKEHGCYFALDDFGSGLSSFAYLKGLPVDFLKIDGAFVRDIEHEKGDLAIVKSIHEIGKALDKKTIAEFVENDSILQILKGIGVDYAQGFGIDRPKPLIDINRKGKLTVVKTA